MSVGAVHLAVSDVELLIVRLTFVGGCGATACGVTAEDGEEAGLEPLSFFATTVKVYAVPFVNPVTSHVVAGAVAVQVLPSGLDVTT